jgi:chaperone modulatory protein CbpM
MMRLTAVVARFTDLGEAELVSWIERGWVRPERAEPDWIFEDIDVARVRLVHDLRHAMALNEDTIPLILSLLDQVYDLRDRLRTVLRAVDRQPDAVRQAVIDALER